MVPDTKDDMASLFNLVGDLADGESPARPP
jgi:hypothetical protein